MNDTVVLFLRNRHTPIMSKSTKKRERRIASTGPRSTSPKPTSISHMRAGVSFHRGPPDSDVVALNLSIEDPCSLLVDYDPLTHPPTPDPLTKGLLR